MNKSLGELAENQQRANELWKTIKHAVTLGKPFLFHLEDGAEIEFNDHECFIRAAATPNTEQEQG